MGSDKRYNGWANYETWNVALWIGNEQGTERQSREMAQAAWDEAGEGVSAYAQFTGREIFTREERAALSLEKAIREWVEEEMVPDLGACMASDLLGAALSEVDWREIAENWLADVDKSEEPDNDEAANG